MLIAVLAVVALPRPAAYAGDKEWATAGKILAGVVGAAVVHEIATSGREERTVYVSRHYYGEPIRRVRYVRSPQRVWIPGHYETRCERVWIEGYWEEVWIPPEYKNVRVTRYDARGHRTTFWKRVLVREGYHDRTWHEGYWDTHEVREWVPGYWQYR